MNAVDIIGSTSLHYAAQNAIMTGELDVVRLLLDAGADVNTKDVDGSTPLGIVKAMGRGMGMDAPFADEVAALLRQHGAR